MESTRTAAPPNLGTIAKAITKLRRLRRHDDDGIEKLKFSANIGDFPTKLCDHHRLDSFFNPEADKHQLSKEREAMDSLLANLFASISAIKASYAQLQFAQSPYDPDSIQSADAAVVAELKRLSNLKKSYINNQLQLQLPSPLAVQIEEQRNLLKTYQITTRKLESDLQLKDADVRSLQHQLLHSEKQHRALEARLYPGRSLAALDDLHLSGLNPTHFLTALRYAFKSVRSFVKLMTKEMESNGWDLDNAAAAIHPAARRSKPGHHLFAFESYVCNKMFSDFHRRDFNLTFLEERSKWDGRRFFEEFTLLKSANPKQLFDSAFGKFCTTKYLSLVHPKMEASFFGNLEQRALLSSGRGFPESPWFAEFAEMARRVWILHCLFFAFESKDEEGGAAVGSIFQVRSGSRYSEVYMESLVEEDGGDDFGGRPTVAFTVVPGFRVGRTVIQCKVYLSSRGGRS
ncbi:protein GRAVITROPIC IN THE LIGHT 1-like [Typha angustifolia]|uniref:protein GRAVITROPIC IN THE LIGHT 1-like n=1 Tax=Typha angustifolia TaxID=59011 RepID=UPI003C2EE703